MASAQKLNVYIGAELREGPNWTSVSIRFGNNPLYHVFANFDGKNVARRASEFAHHLNKGYRDGSDAVIALEAATRTYQVSHMNGDMLTFCAALCRG